MFAASLGGYEGLFEGWPKRVVLGLWMVTKVKKSVFLRIFISAQF